MATEPKSEAALNRGGEEYYTMAKLVGPVAITAMTFR